MAVLGVFLLIVGTCFAQNYTLQPFFLSNDGEAIMDSVINAIQSKVPVRVPAPDVALNLVDPSDTNAQVGSLVGTRGAFYNLNSINRIAPVSTFEGIGALWLNTSVSFSSLNAQYTTQLNFSGVVIQTLVSATVGNNKFDLSLGIHSDSPTGCQVDVGKASFYAVSGVQFSLLPLGFFNQLRATATLDHVSQDVIRQLNHVDLSVLQAVIQNEICQNVFQSIRQALYYA